MKKQVIAATLAALTIASPAFAHEAAFAHVFGHLNLGENASQFIVVGSVDSVGSNMLVVNALGSAHINNLTDGKVTIKTDSNTKISANDKKDQTLVLSDIKVGQKVLVEGTVSGSTLTAKTVRLIDIKAKIENAGKKKAVGEITAKTDDSITIKNALTGVSTTISTNDDTKVNIDGEKKSLDDVQVGDKGWIKLKLVGTTLFAKFMHLFR